VTLPIENEGVAGVCGGVASDGIGIADIGAYEFYQHDRIFLATFDN
jgi:hypothetical protein